MRRFARWTAPSSLIPSGPTSARRMLARCVPRENSRKHDSSFRRALNLDPSSQDATAGLASVRGEPKQELRLGEDNDTYNFAGANHAGWVSLVSNWTPHWTTSVAGNFFEIFGANAGKFVGSVTGPLARLGSADHRRRDCS